MLEKSLKLSLIRNFSLIILLTITSVKVFGQDTLFYNDIVSNKYKKLKNNTEFKFYKDKGGHVFKKGDKLKILNPENPNNISKNTLMENVYGNFTYILKYRDFVFTAEKTFSGEEIEIESIYIFNMPILKKTPIEVFFQCKLNRNIDRLEKLYIKDIDKAISQKEVEIFGVFTKEQAILELKKLKELLDLQLINQKDYDKRKEELRSLILN